jgi:hypothetical protein
MRAERPTPRGLNVNVSVSTARQLFPGGVSHSFTAATTSESVLSFHQAPRLPWSNKLQP